MSRRCISLGCLCLLLPAAAGAQAIPEEIQQELEEFAKVLPPQPYAVSSVRATAGGSPVQGVDDGEVYAPPLTDKCWPAELPTMGAFAGTVLRPISLEVTIQECGPPDAPPEPPDLKALDAEPPVPGLLPPKPPIPKLPATKPPTPRPQGAEPIVECAWELDPFTANDPSCRQLEASELTGTASWEGLQGTVDLPPMAQTGAYKLMMKCTVNGLPTVPPVLAYHYVTYSEPLAVFSPPDRDWYAKAACWAGGMSADDNEEDVLEAILAGIYTYGQHNWLYGYANQGETDGSYSFEVSATDAGTRTIEYTIDDTSLRPKCTTRCKCYWQGMVAESSPCNFGDCYVFSDVLQAISGVMGVGGLTYDAVTGEAGLGFLTHPTASLDPKFSASVGCADDEEVCYPYFFSSHSLRGRNGRYYDATFDSIYSRLGQPVALSKEQSVNDFVTFLDSQRVLYSSGSQYGSWAFYDTLPTDLQLSLTRDLSAVKLTGDATFTPKDANQDGVYDYLVAELGVQIILPGSYVIEGMLTKDVDGKVAVVAHQPSYWSSQPSTTLVSGAPGTTTATLYFSGQEIFQSGLDGPYDFHAKTHENDAELQKLSIVTGTFDHEKFGELAAAIDDGTETEGVDDNGDGLFDQLRITVPIVARTATEWGLGARLSKDGETIGYAGTKRQTDAGSYPVELDIAGDQIAARGLDGPWDLTLVLFNGRLMAEVDVQLEVRGYTAASFE